MTLQLDCCVLLSTLHYTVILLVHKDFSPLNIMSVWNQQRSIKKKKKGYIFAEMC